VQNGYSIAKAIGNKKENKDEQSKKFRDSIAQKNDYNSKMLLIKPSN